MFRGALRAKKCLATSLFLYHAFILIKKFNALLVFLPLASVLLQGGAYLGSFGLPLLLFRCCSTLDAFEPSRQILGPFIFLLCRGFLFPFCSAKDHFLFTPLFFLHDLGRFSSAVDFSVGFESVGSGGSAYGIERSNQCPGAVVERSCSQLDGSRDQLRPSVLSFRSQAPQGVMKRFVLSIIKLINYVSIS